MARQTQPLFMQCTYDDLTFYKRGGKFYMRSKSSLSRQRVKTAPEFQNTRQHNQLLVNASKIASVIYSQLPIKWRQFWMYQAFTGEAMSFLQQGHSPNQTETTLYNTYIAYWIAWQQQTGITLPTGKTSYKKANKTYKTRLKHFTESTANKRANNTNGRWKQNRNRNTQPQSKQKRPSGTQPHKPNHKKMRGKMLQTLRRALIKYPHPLYLNKKRTVQYINDCLAQTTFARSP